MKLVRLIKMCLNETQSNVCTGKNLSDALPTQNGLQRNTILPLLYNFALVHAIRNIQENQEEMELNGTQKLC